MNGNCHRRCCHVAFIIADKEVIQPLHALISVMFSFCFWHVVLDAFIAFRQTIVRNTCVLPYAKAILISASMFYVGQGGIAFGRT